jgi:hypothetical protein
MRRIPVKSTIIVVLLLSALCFNLSADVVGTADIDVNIDVTAVAAITVSGAAVSFSVGGSPAAGALPIVTDTSNTPTYLQYTSVVPDAETRTIAVQSDLALPAGLRLGIRAGTPTGHGGIGTAVSGGVTIDSTYTGATDLTIVTGITSCATGTGTTQGTPIYYTLSIDEATFEDLDVTAATQTITLTYTLVGS